MDLMNTYFKTNRNMMSWLLIKNIKFYKDKTEN